MKTMKIALIATLITALIICSCACALPACAEDRGEFYPLLTVVVGWENIGEDLTLVTCMDREGNLWSFYSDPAEWKIGDLANLLMWNLQEIEEADEVIEVYYEGRADLREWFN